MLCCGKIAWQMVKISIQMIFLSFIRMHPCEVFMFTNGLLPSLHILLFSCQIEIDVRQQSELCLFSEA